MNVYDFDKTIYNGYTLIDFYFFCVKENIKIIKYVFSHISSLIGYIFGIYDKKTFVSRYFSYLQDIDNIDETVNRFWQRNEKKIYFRFIKNHTEEDIIVTSLPRFLIFFVCKKMNVKNIIATQINIETGELLYDNLSEESKLKNYIDIYGKDSVERYYTDSKHHKSFCRIAKKSYITKKGEIIEWEDYEETRFEKILKFYLNREFISFLLIGFINFVDDVVFSLIFSVLYDTYIAFICGFTASVIVSYFLNAKFTFRKNYCFKDFYRFILSYLPNLIIQIVFIYIIFGIFKLPKTVAYTVSGLITMPVTFFILKIFVYTKKYAQNIKNRL